MYVLRWDLFLGFWEVEVLEVTDLSVWGVGFDVGADLRESSGRPRVGPLQRQGGGVEVRGGHGWAVVRPPTT